MAILAMPSRGQGTRALPCRELQNMVTSNFRNAAILAASSGAGKMPALRKLSLYSAILNRCLPGLIAGWVLQLPFVPS